MKNKYLLCISVFFLSLSSIAQDLTKEETVNYINKKLEEVVGQYFQSSYLKENKVTYQKDGYISHSDLLANYKDAYCGGISGYKSNYAKATFKPNHIVKVDSVKSNSRVVGILRVEFLPNTARWVVQETTTRNEEIYKREFSHYNFFGDPVYHNVYKGMKYHCETRDKATASNAVYIYFLKSDPTNYTKLYRAFNHLAALYKAEDDPFGF